MKLTGRNTYYSNSEKPKSPTLLTNMQWWRRKDGNRRVPRSYWSHVDSASLRLARITHAWSTYALLRIHFVVRRRQTGGE